MEKAVMEQQRWSFRNRNLALTISMLLFFNANIFAQFPNNVTTGNASTLYHDAGGRTANGGFVNTRFPDTTTANTYPIAGQKGGQIIVGNTVYIRDSTTTKWLVSNGGSGGSGIDSSSFHSITQSTDSTSAKFNRPNGTGSVLKFIYDTTGGGSSGITQQQLDDTASAIRGSFYLKSQIDAFLAAKQNTINVTTTGSGAATWDGTNLNIPTPSIPAQFNPIAGTGMSLTGSYPNVTFNSTASGGVSTVSADLPLSVTNPTTTPNITADTSKSQGNLATFNDVLTHKDSSAYHTSQVIGDSLLVLCDLLGRCDTIAMASINVWQRNGNYIYYKNGNVGINTDTAHAPLYINTGKYGTVSDTAALVVANDTPATNGTQQPSGGIRLSGYGFATTPSTSQRVDWLLKDVITQSALNPTHTLTFYQQVNGLGYLSPFTFTQAGTFTAATQVNSPAFFATTGFYSNGGPVSASLNSGTALQIQPASLAAIATPSRNSPNSYITGYVWDSTASISKNASWYNYISTHGGATGNMYSYWNLAQTGPNGSSTPLSVKDNGQFIFLSTNTASGTTGAQTINKTSGTVNFAAGATSLVVTNSLCSTASIIQAICRTNDTNKTKVYAVVPANGSFTIYVDAASGG